MRLIDAEGLLSIVRRMTVVDKSVMHRILIQTPTVDAVPVVRCKDCGWWTRQDKSLQGRCARYGTYPTGEWFCAAGRKDVNDGKTD